MNENKDRPGMSGKEAGKKPWFNKDKYREQRDFVHQMDESEKGFAESTGQNLHGRSDLSNQEGNEKRDLEQQQILEVLKRSPEVDVSKVDVSVYLGTVTLKGIVDHPNESRAVESIVKNIPGVDKVNNELQTRGGVDLPH